MAKIKFEHGLEVEHDGEEYILRFKAPRVKLDPDLTGGHLKQGKKGRSSRCAEHYWQGNKS